MLNKDCYYLVFDPGKDKCGLLLADIKRKNIIKAEIISKDFVINKLSNWYLNFCFHTILIGDGTYHKYWMKEISSLNLTNLQVIIVDERNTTRRAKDKYHSLYPLRGILKLVPKDFFIINKNLDSIAALIMLEVER